MIARYGEQLLSLLVSAGEERGEGGYEEATGFWRGRVPMPSPLVREPTLCLNLVCRRRSSVTVTSPVSVSMFVKPFGQTEWIMVSRGRVSLSSPPLGSQFGPRKHYQGPVGWTSLAWASL